MPNLLVRGAEPKDAQTYADWLQATPSNLYDPAVYKYPTTVTLVVEKNDEPQLMNSFQGAMVIEALAPKPGLSPLQEARALNQLFQAWRAIAAKTGIKEIYFTTADNRVGNFVEGRGWERLKHPVYRCKL